MTREFSIESSNIEIFNEFFHKIPQQNLDAFINTVLLINYTINQTELTRQDLEDSIGSQFDSIISKKYSEKSIVEKEEGFRNNNFEIERQLIRCIETGDIDKLNKFKTRFKNAKTGIIANNNLRHWKNTFIVLVALACRAAMKGGLTPSVAYQLSDIYIQQVERLSDVDAIMSLNMQVQLDYTNRVANSIIPSNSDIILHQVIQYIRENTNKNITVAEVANQVGFTRPSLSRKFKKELGFDVSTFIRKCKLEEAKDLLAFSGKSISEISSYLCFSSQSHFQKVFKDHFGITPDSYRRSV
jgi:AraC-like DNA-binding protein